MQAVFNAKRKAAVQAVQDVQKEVVFTNPFTLTHGYLSEASHSDVPENATFYQATGTMVAIKEFIDIPRAA